MRHKLRITVEVELDNGDVDMAYRYLNRANEGYPDPHGCAPVFWAIDEGMRSIGNKMHDWHRETVVKLQIVAGGVK